MAKPKRSKFHIRIEIPMLIAVIVCLSWMMNYDATYRSNNFISITPSGTLMMVHRHEDIDRIKNSGRPIIDYKRNTCQSIELYDENYNSLDKVIFTYTEDIHDELIHRESFQQMIMTSDCGDVIISEDVIDVTGHFNWIEYNGKRYLVVYVTNNVAARNLAIFNFIGACALALSFALLCISMYWQLRGISRRYKQSLQDLYCGQ